MRRGSNAKKWTINQQSLQPPGQPNSPCPMSSSNQITNLNITTIEKGGSVNFGNIIIEGNSFIEYTTGGERSNESGEINQPVTPITPRPVTPIAPRGPVLQRIPAPLLHTTILPFRSLQLSPHQKKR